MAVYRTRKGGNWYYRFRHNGQDFNGTCHGCATKSAAEGYEAGIRAALARLDQQQTLNDLFLNCRDMLAKKNGIPLKDAYRLAMGKPQKRTAGEARMGHKRNYWDDFAAYVAATHPEAKTLQDITQSIAEGYIARVRSKGLFTDGKGKVLAHATLNEIHAALRQVFALLSADTGLAENPFAAIPTMPSDSDGHEPYTMEELRLIFSRADEGLLPLFMVGLFSGLRLGDICTLERADIDLPRGFIVRRQRKTGGTVAIPMYKALADFIGAALAKSDAESKYVFPELATQYLKNASTITARVRKFLHDVGIESTKGAEGRARKLNAKGIHSLRHTFCTVAGAMGIPETIVRSIVGHLTPRMTELYTRHVADKDKAEWMGLFGDRMAAVGGGGHFSLPVSAA